MRGSLAPSCQVGFFCFSPCYHLRKISFGIIKTDYVVALNQRFLCLIVILCQCFLYFDHVVMIYPCLLYHISLVDVHERCSYFLPSGFYQLMTPLMNGLLSKWLHLCSVAAFSILMMLAILFEKHSMQWAAMPICGCTENLPRLLGTPIYHPTGLTEWLKPFLSITWCKGSNSCK